VADQDATGGSRSSHRSRLKQTGLIAALVLIVGWVGFEFLMAAVGDRGSGGGDGDAPKLIDWQYDYQTALAKAKARDQPVLLEFTADWCPPCQWMKRHVFSDPEVAQAIESRYVPIRVDASEQAAPERKMMQRWGVRGIPTFIVLDGSGESLMRFAGRRDKAAFLQWVKSGPAPSTQPAEQVEQAAMTGSAVD
jgi:thiol:disulfide interchange protein